MDRYWWTVWVKVAVLAVVLFLAYNFVSGIVQDIFEPYLIEEGQVETEAPAEEADADIIKKLFGKFESVFGVQIDYENFIFEFSNEYAQTMMDQSYIAHNSAEIGDECWAAVKDFF